jgi:hypothetical protein
MKLKIETEKLKIKNKKLIRHYPDVKVIDYNLGFFFN